MSDSFRKPAWPSWKYLLQGTAFSLLWLPVVLAGITLIGMMFLGDSVGILLFHLGILLLCAAWFWRRWFLRKMTERELPRSFAICLLPLFLPVWYVLVVATVFFFWAFSVETFAIALGPYLAALLVVAIFGGAMSMFWGAMILTGLTALLGVRRVVRNATHASGKLHDAVKLLTITAILAVCCMGAYMRYRTQVLTHDRSSQRIRDETRAALGRPARFYRDETDLTAYVPFSETNKLVTVESPTLCISSSNPLRLHGALALYPVYAAAAQAVYAYDSNCNYAHLVQTGTSPEAFSALMGDQCDMAFMVNPSEKQLAEAREKGKALEITKIGREAFVFFVSSVNPVDGLTSAQIRDIYGKRVTNWKRVGGKSERILPFQRPEGSGSQTAMLRFMGDAPLAKPVREEFQQMMGGIVNRVADYRNYGNAIGFSFRYYVEGLFKHDGVKLLAIDGVAPTVENIRSGAYPLVSDFVIVTAGSANPHIKELTEWFLSPQGQELIEKVGYVPLGEP